MEHFHLPSCPSSWFSTWAKAALFWLSARPGRRDVTQGGWGNRRQAGPEKKKQEAGRGCDKMAALARSDQRSSFDASVQTGMIEFLRVSRKSAESGPFECFP